MALHGDGHLELKKIHKGDFWGIFGIRLERCPCIIPEKISFLQFYSRFNPNALALMATRGDDIGFGGRGNQTSTTRWNNAVLMLTQRRRRWANIKTALSRRAVSDGKLELSEAFWR